jgi:hypothetical protein
VTAVAVLLAAGACAGSDTPDAPPASPTASVGTPSPASATASPVQIALPPGKDFHWRITVAPNGATALLAASDGFFPGTRESTIYQVTRLADGGCGDAAEVPFVDATSSDIDPFYAKDGSRVCFSSIRPVGGVARDDVDLWYVDRSADGTWGDPVNAAAVNSDADDLFPSVARDGALYVGSDRGGSGFDIWHAAAQSGSSWAEPTALPPPVSTPQWEFNPVVSPSGSALVFTALDRTDGRGKGDLYLSRAAAGGGWSTPVSIDAVNTSADEYHPAFSPDGATLRPRRRAVRDRGRRYCTCSVTRAW